MKRFSQRKRRKVKFSKFLLLIEEHNPFRQFKRKERRILSRTALLFSVFLITWITFGGNGLLNYLEVKEELANTINKKENIQKENEKLRQQIARIQEDPNYLEKVARQQYYMKKDNEILFSFD